MAPSPIVPNLPPPLASATHLLPMMLAGYGHSHPLVVSHPGIGHHTAHEHHGHHHSAHEHHGHHKHHAHGLKAYIASPFKMSHHRQAIFLHLFKAMFKLYLRVLVVASTMLGSAYLMFGSAFVHGMQRLLTAIGSTMIHIASYGGQGQRIG